MVSTTYLEVDDGDSKSYNSIGQEVSLSTPIGRTAYTLAYPDGRRDWIIEL